MRVKGITTKVSWSVYFRLLNSNNPNWVWNLIRFLRYTKKSKELFNAEGWKTVGHKLILMWKLRQLMSVGAVVGSYIIICLFSLCIIAHLKISESVVTLYEILIRSAFNMYGFQFTISSLRWILIWSNL